MAVTDRLGATVSATEAPSSSTPNAGLAIKTAVRAATAAAITLNGLQTIDGVALNAGDRVLVKNQSDQTTNGIYNASTGNWAASSDFQSNSQLACGAIVAVNFGTLNADSVWQLISDDPVELGVTAITFGPLSFLGSAPPASGFGLYKASATLLGLDENGTNIIPFVAPTGVSDPSTGIGGAGVSGGAIPRLNESWVQTANYHFLLSTDDTIFPGQISVRGTWATNDVASFRLSWNSGATVRSYSHTVTNSDTNQTIAQALQTAMVDDPVLQSLQIYTQATFNSSGSNWDWQYVPHFGQYPVAFTNTSTSGSGTIAAAIVPSNLLADPVGLYVARSVSGRTPQAGDFVGEIGFYAQTSSGPGTVKIARMQAYNDDPGVSARFQFQTYDSNINGIRNAMIIRQGVYLQDGSGAGPTDGTAGDKGWGWFNVPLAGGYDLSGKGTLTYNSGATAVELVSASGVELILEQTGGLSLSFNGSVLTVGGTGNTEFAIGNGTVNAELLCPASGSFTIATTTNSSISIGVNSVQVVEVTSNGIALTPGIIAPSVDSTTGLRLMNAALGASVVTVDTSNHRVGINKAPGAFDLDVGGQVQIGAQLALGGNLYFGGGNLIYPSVDSTTAIAIANNGGTRFVTFDSSNKRVGINKTPGAFDLDVNGAVNIGGALTLGSNKVLSTAGAAASAQPSNPTGTVSTVSSVMCGLGATCVVTPVTSSRLRVSFYGYGTVTSTGQNGQLKLQYGTGTAPSNGAALAGTQLGTTLALCPASAGNGLPFNMEAILTGLTPGIAYWFDLAQISGSGSSTFAVNGVNFSANEV